MNTESSADNKLLGDFYSRDQLADELHVTKRTLERWRVMRRGPAQVKIGRSVFYPRAAVQKWLADGGSAR